MKSIREKLNSIFRNPQREAAGPYRANSFITEAEIKGVRPTVTTSCAENCKVTKQEPSLAMENRSKTVSVTDS